MIRIKISIFFWGIFWGISATFRWIITKDFPIGVLRNRFSENISLLSEKKFKLNEVQNPVQRLFETLPNIYDKKFWENTKQLKLFPIFPKSYIIDSVINKPLQWHMCCLSFPSLVGYEPVAKNRHFLPNALDIWCWWSRIPIVCINT